MRAGLVQIESAMRAEDDVNADLPDVAEPEDRLNFREDVICWCSLQRRRRELLQSRKSKLLGAQHVKGNFKKAPKESKILSASAGSRCLGAGHISQHPAQDVRFEPTLLRRLQKASSTSCAPTFQWWTVVRCFRLCPLAQLCKALA